MKIRKLFAYFCSFHCKFEGLNIGYSKHVLDPCITGLPSELAAQLAVGV